MIEQRTLHVGARDAQIAFLCSDRMRAYLDLLDSEVVHMGNPSEFDVILQG